MTPLSTLLRFGSLLIIGSFSTGAELQQAAVAPTPASNAAPIAASPAVASTVTPATVKVILRTNAGDIVLALEKERAPITVGNFLRYVDQKRFDGSSFYRAMKLDDAGQFGLIQGGLRGNPRRILKPIAHESTGVTGLSHLSGAISMARNEPGSATADFFIVIGDLVSFDAQPDAGADPGYAVFGHVVDGMDVVRAILELPRDADAGQGVMKGQMLADPVKILTARRSD